MERNERMFSIALAVVLLCLTAVVSTTLWLSVQRMPPHNADYMTRGEVERIAKVAREDADDEV